MTRHALSGRIAALETAATAGRMRIILGPPGVGGADLDHWIAANFPVVLGVMAIVLEDFGEEPPDPPCQ